GSAAASRRACHKPAHSIHPRRGRSLLRNLTIARMQQVQEPLPELGELLGGRWQLQALGASAFCDTWEARQGRDLLFLKRAAEAGADMLRAEADGLRALAATRTVRVPSVHAVLDRPG